MKVTRNRLEKIIRESISKVLNEYRGEQLTLPFDGGDTGAVNYEQYIDFVNSITKPGEITSSVNNLGEYVNKLKTYKKFLFEVGMNACFYNGYCREEFSNDEYEDRIEELEERYGDKIYGENNNPLSQEFGIGEELSNYGFKCFANMLIEHGADNLDYIMNILKNYCVNGMLYINRELTIPKALGRYSYNDDDDSYDSLYSELNSNFSDLGDYWSYGKEGGSAYYGVDFSNGTSTVNLIAMTPIENIDIPNTCGLDTVGEYEVSFIDNSKIMLVGLSIDGKEINIGHRVYK